jgi:hypothetical protein
MQVQPVAFTGSGIVGAAGFTGTTTSPLTGQPFDAPLTNNHSIVVPQQPQRVVGFAYTGFTQVVLYNGSDNTGDVLAVGGGAGTYSFSYEVNANRGLYVGVTGTGAGTVWLA